MQSICDSHCVRPHSLVITFLFSVLVVGLILAELLAFPVKCGRLSAISLRYYLYEKWVGTKVHFFLFVRCAGKRKGISSLLLRAKQTDSRLGCSPASIRDFPIHSDSLYASSWFFLLFWYSNRIKRKRRKEKSKKFHPSSPCLQNPLYP